jgi:hypothetical protein
MKALSGKQFYGLMVARQKLDGLKVNYLKSGDF